MTNYRPDERLMVEGDASEVDARCEAVGVEVIGSVASVEGVVSHIIVDGTLSESDLTSLSDEFGVEWTKSEQK